MKLYLVVRTDEVGYDEFDSFVVAANDEAEAKSVPHYWGDWEPDLRKVVVTEIGTANRQRPGVVHSSFNAG